MNAFSHLGTRACNDKTKKAAETATLMEVCFSLDSATMTSIKIRIFSFIPYRNAHKLDNQFKIAALELRGIRTNEQFEFAIFSYEIAVLVVKF